MFYLLGTLLLLTAPESEFCAGITTTCNVSFEDVTVDTLFFQDTQYHLISIDGFTMPLNTPERAGLPSVPYATSTLLLPPGTQIDSVATLSETWDTLPGKYFLYPAQSGFLADTVFAPANFTTAFSAQVFPEKPVTVSRQGSAMGYSVATLSCSPLRYIPEDSTVLVLTSAVYELTTKPPEYEQTIPERETEFSAAVRNRGISSLVSNPSEVCDYPEVCRTGSAGRTAALNISEQPSLQGDAVDMVIVTGSELAPAFQEFADYRTCQGIVTVVRTVQWIDQFYSGCDTQERIRNFIRDAHLKWGIQAVILGGDDGVVPVREANGWDYTPDPFPAYQLPSDDYYADIDGSWSYNGTCWRPESIDSFLDLCVGRWPCNTPDDVNLLFNKIKLYELPENFPDNYARKLLVIGSNNPAGSGASDMAALVSQLVESQAVPEHLDPPATLYFPHSLPGGDLCRNTALSEFDQGYNVVFHADHSEIHKLATAGKGTLGQYMWDSDFSTMDNTGMPSILWTLGCETGHFDGACCYSETGLLTSSNSGLVASISNARGGIHAQKITAYAFSDALYSTGWIADITGASPLHWPLSYLGEAFRCSKNTASISFIYMNFLGSPLMYVWRDNPERLTISTPTMFLTEGVPGDISVTVTDGVYPVEGAAVCLWKKNEVFSILETDNQGHALFEDVVVADGSGDTDLVLTAVKRRQPVNTAETTTADYIPGRITLDVLPANVPVVSLGSFTVDPDGDGTANPGETVNINLTAVNSGGETGTDVEVEMSVVSGTEYIESVVNDHSQFPDISPGETENSTEPLAIAVNTGTPNYSAIHLNLHFTWSGSSGQFSWDSSLLLTVYSESYDLTVVDPSADNSSGRTASVNLSNMVLANCGSGDGKTLNITVNNLQPQEPFLVNTLTLPELFSNTAVELSGELNLIVSPVSPGSSWLKPGFPGCSFDVTIESNGGVFTARNMDVEMISQLQYLNLQPPENLSVYETGQDYISLTWEHSGVVDADAYYAYCNDGVSDSRVYPLPVPVKQITINGLIPGRTYDAGITAIDETGRESEQAVVSAYTTQPLVNGWPLYLQGSPGGGPVVIDVDNDGFDEIVTAISSGFVYIIERDGTFQKLYPPSGYDFDRFLGCAAGDVDGDSNVEIVVTCQRKIEVPGQEQVAVLLFNREGGVWSSTEIASTIEDEEVSSPNIAGTPVLFQADNGNTLEIALRTRGNNGGIPHLYVWRFDQAGNSWIDYSTAFPVELIGSYFSPPVAVDFDNDGFQELVLTVFGSAGVGTALLVADFLTAGDVAVSLHNLSELDTSGEMARTFGTIASAEQDGITYITGAAKTDTMSGILKKIFVYSLHADPSVHVTPVWQTDWLTGIDSYGNMPGPSFGNVDNDPELEVLYSLNGGSFNSEGFTVGWDLISGTIDFQSELIPYNPILGEGGASVKSQAVTGITTLPGSGELAVFSGFSSLFCAHDPRTSTSMVSGFPGGAREGAWAAPSVCDLDGDGTAEILYIDYSGYASLFDWQEGSYTTDGWHMYQDNPLRNGFYNSAENHDRLDIRVTGESSILHNSRNSQLSVVSEIEIRNSETLSEQQLSFSPATSAVLPTCNSALPEREIALPAASENTVELAVFVNGTYTGSTSLPLEDGIQRTVIPVGAETELNSVITVVADPFNLIDESDETNNTSIITETVAPQTSAAVVIPTPSRQIELTVQLPEPLAGGLEITVYSLDGRVAVKMFTGALSDGTTNLIVSSDANRPLSSGVYTVRIEGTGFAETTGKVVVLNR